MLNYCQTTDDVIKEGYCSGCGVCTYKNNYTVVLNEDGCLQARKTGQNTAFENAVCPFLSAAKNELGHALFAAAEPEAVSFEPRIGYYRDLYAGHVKDTSLRRLASSGGLTTWICTKLLEEHWVDQVISVAASRTQDGRLCFKYRAAASAAELGRQAKTKYYPVTLQEVLAMIKRSPRSRYAVVALPCFVRGLRQLCQAEPELQERIVFCIGLVCGHLKSTFFTEALAWDLGVAPADLQFIDYRDKVNTRSAAAYNVAVTDKTAPDSLKRKNTAEIYGYNWGWGLFKYKACDYCEDVLNETADITLGDAWLPAYTRDPAGSNIVIVRHPLIKQIMDTHADELVLDRLDEATIIASQSGGFRHRQDGLAYRLYVAAQKHIPLPRTVIQPALPADKKRRKIYAYRVFLRELSFTAFKEAQERQDYAYFIKRTRPALRRYDRFYSGGLLRRALRKIRRLSGGPSA